MRRGLTRFRGRALTVLLLCSVAILLHNALFGFSYTIGPNYRNVSVDTRVNITNAAPEIIAMTCPNPVTLSAGSALLLECNVSVRDYNGYADINLTEAYFYYYDTSSPVAADDNNTHYSNANCTIVEEGGNWRNFTCNFTLYYYALNGTWTFNASTYDTTLFSDTNATNVTVNALLALNVTSLIDYGDLSIGETSANRTANVTNFGNVPINVSVKGYGVYEGDGLAFNCTQGTIAIENEKFSVNRSHVYADKTSLGASFGMIANLSIEKQDTPGLMRTNTTYWQLYVPPNPFGECNGTVVFQAMVAD